MEGGRDWWQQITAAIDRVQYLVLVMTPAALASPLVRREWRYARQRGVAVYPVKAQAELDFEALPRWMRSAHFYDLDHEWRKFVADLNTRPQAVRVPFMVEDMPEDSFPDRPWGKGNNPKTAVWEYLKTHPEFEVDQSIPHKLQITVAPDGFLRRLGSPVA